MSQKKTYCLSQYILSDTCTSCIAMLYWSAIVSCSLEELWTRVTVSSYSKGSRRLMVFMPMYVSCHRIQTPLPLSVQLTCHSPNMTVLVP